MEMKSNANLSKKPNHQSEFKVSNPSITKSVSSKAKISVRSPTKENIGSNRKCQKISSKSSKIKNYACLKVETTGLINHYSNSSKTPKYDKLEYYEEARVICIKWNIYEKTENNKISEKEILVLNKKLTISDLNQQIHKISSDEIEKQGVSIDKALDEFMESMKSVDLIIAHNIEFHLNVIKSELFRLGRKKDINQINKKLSFCTSKDVKELFPNPIYNEKIHQNYFPGCEYVPKYLKKTFEDLCMLILEKKVELKEYLDSMKEILVRLKEMQYIDF